MKGCCAGFCAHDGVGSRTVENLEGSWAELDCVHGVGGCAPLCRLIATLGSLLDK